MNLFRCGELNLDDARNIDRLEESVRVHYNEFIGKFILENNLSGTDLLLTSTCRNTISTNTLDIFCRVALLEENIKKGQVPVELFFEDIGVDDLVQQVLNKYNVTGTKITRIKKNKINILTIGLNILKSFYLIVNSWFWPRIYKVKKIPSGKIIYVDTFLFIDSIDDRGNYFERYYTGHEKYLPIETVNSEWFVPTLVDIKHPREFIKICKDLNKTNRRFILQESFLTISDYFSALFMSIYLPFKIKKFTKYNTYDVKKILKQLLVEDIGAPALFKSLCQYYFIKRLRKQKVDICHAINWAENQNIDRALNLSFKKYYPEVKVYGYQGFPVLGYYASTQPTCYELDADTLPDVLNVISPPCINSRKLVCDRLDVQLAPAFRFSYLYNIEQSKFEDSKTILIAMPGFGIKECRAMLKTYLDIADSMSKNIMVIVKQHPAYTIEKFSELVPEFCDQRVTHTSRKIPELLGNTSVLISSGSSVCVEAVALGIPVLIYGDRYGITKNTIPHVVPKEMWNVFYTSEELRHQLEIALRRHNSPMIKELFCEVNEEGARKLFAVC